MVSTFFSFGALFTSALFVMMGASMLNTQLSLRMTQVGFSTATIGITLACYFLGLVFGYFLCHRLIQRVFDSAGWTHPVLCRICRYRHNNHYFAWPLHISFFLGDA
jgi:hypothetical protein